MTPSRRGSTPAPSPTAAGAVLLVHDLKNLAARLQLLEQNLAQHFGNPQFKPSALEVLDTSVRHLQRLAVEQDAVLLLAVIHEALAVVRQENDERVVVEPGPGHPAHREAFRKKPLEE